MTAREAENNGATAAHARINRRSLLDLAFDVRAAFTRAMPPYADRA